MHGETGATPTVTAQSACAARPGNGAESTGQAISDSLPGNRAVIISDSDFKFHFNFGHGVSRK